MSSSSPHSRFLEQLAVERYADRPGERLVRLVAPGHYADGRLIREVYDRKSNSYHDAPIPRLR